MKKPPLLPDEALRRVLRTAHMDGMGILVISGAFALFEAESRDRSGMIVCLLVAAAGAIELHGGSQLRRGERGGLLWLVGSQIYLLAVLLSYVSLRLAHIDINVVRELLTDDVKKQITDSGMTVDEFAHGLYGLFYRLVGGLSILYQGGMALYYLRRRAAVSAALEEV
jgi:hypothetical protein